jgi:hypothetical protein
MDVEIDVHGVTRKRVCGLEVEQGAGRERGAGIPKTDPGRCCRTERSPDAVFPFESVIAHGK